MPIAILAFWALSLAWPTHAAASRIPFLELGPMRSHCGLYLTQMERKSFEISLENDRLTYPSVASNTRIDAMGREAEGTLQDGRYFSVLADNDEWFAAYWRLEFEDPNLKHWSFTGKPVRWAGLFELENRTIHSLFNDSGSYLPSPSHMLMFVRYLEEKKAPLAPDLELHFPSKPYPKLGYLPRPSRFFPVRRSALEIDSDFGLTPNEQWYLRLVQAGLQVPSRNLAGRVNQVLAAMTVRAQVNQEVFYDRVRSTIDELLALSESGGSPSTLPFRFIYSMDNYRTPEFMVVILQRHPDILAKWQRLKRLLLKQ
jgi:hypothetical protein